MRVAFGDKQEKFALASVEGEMICPAVFDDIGDFCEGLARAGIYNEERGKTLYGFINQKAEIVIPAIYEDACDFEDGRALVLMQRASKRACHNNGYKLRVKQTAGWFYIDKAGKPFLCDAEGPKYPIFGEFHEGMCRISTMRIEKDDLAYEVGEGWPHDEMCEHDPGLWGFINEAGVEAIAPQYILVGDFHNGVAIACKGKWVYKKDWSRYEGDVKEGYWTEEMKWGAIDKEGNEVIPFVYQYIIRCEGEGGAEDTFTVRYGDKDNPRWGVLDVRGNWLAKSEDRNIIVVTTPSKEGLFVFLDDNYPFLEVDSLVGIYDSRNNRALFEPQFTDAAFMEDGWIKIVKWKDDGSGHVTKIVDRDGNERFPSDYSLINETIRPYDVVIYDNAAEKSKWVIGRRGLINEDGTVILPCEYVISDREEISYEHRRFVFVENDCEGIIDFDGNVLIPPKYKMLCDLDWPLITFSSQNKRGIPHGLLTLEGKVTLPDVFDWSEWCRDERHILCRRDGVYEMFLLTEKR